MLERKSLKNISLSTLFTAAIVTSACGGSDNTPSVLTLTPSPPVPTPASPPVVGCIGAQGQNNIEPSIGALVTSKAHRSIIQNDSTVNGLIPGVTYINNDPNTIRAAYGLPALPETWNDLNASQSASFGAGQTIYIIDSYQYPNVGIDLNVFSAEFGLPSCSINTLTSSTVLPLGPAGSTCSLNIASLGASSNIVNTPPSYDSGWMNEIAIDVQWVHAMAPLARIVLIQQPDTFVTSTNNAVELANKMGPGVVSMAIGSPESPFVLNPIYNLPFTSPGMTYLAASGDNNEQVQWPAVIPTVIAVGGTSLQWNGTVRTETVWNNITTGHGTGGGISSYVSIPLYQQRYTRIPGEPSHFCSSNFRAINDISLFADPFIGALVMITPPGQSGGFQLWGGTSLATALLAGMLTDINAERALNGKDTIGDPHNTFYNVIGDNPAIYANVLLDVTFGNNAPASGCVGITGTCNAGVGYDIPTGLGTPNFPALMNILITQ